MSIPPIDDMKSTPATLAKNVADANLSNDAIAPGEDKAEVEAIQVAANTATRRTAVNAARTVIDSFRDENGVIKDKADLIESPSVKRAKAAQNAGEDVIIEGGSSPMLNVSEDGKVSMMPATAEEMERLALFADQARRNPAAATDGIHLPNLKNMSTGKGDDADAVLRDFVVATFNTYKDTVTASGQRIIRTGERGFKDVINEANRISSVDAFLMLMQHSPGDRPFTDAEFLAARRTVVAMQINAEKLLKKAQQTGNPLDKLKAAQAISLEGYASIVLFGAQGDLARGLAVQRIMASPSKARVQAMQSMMEKAEVVTNGEITADNMVDYMEAYGGEANLDQMLYYYSIAPNDRTRHEFAKRSMIRKYLADPFVEIYQTALLSNPITHSFNLAGQAVMLELQVLERLFEGRPGEALAMLTAQWKYIGQAFRAGAHALRYEQALTDGTSKLDVDMKAISSEAFGIDRQAGGIQSAAGAFVDGFGILMRMQGYRPMVAVDETYKVMARGMQTEALAHRAKVQAQKSARERGMTEDEILEEGQAAYLQTLHSQETFEQAADFARMVTFQDDLPAFLQNAGGLMNHPLLKIWLPFYKTPTNIFLRVTERTPFGILLPNNLKKMITGSNAERRAVLSKIGVSSSIAATTMALSSGMYGDGIVITGYGPRKQKLRANWLETHEPYSIGVKREDGGYEWISYARYDPLSGVLALAADSKEVLFNSEDPEAQDDIFMNMTIATTQYVGTALPMLQFVGELVDLQGSPYADTDSKIERIRELISKQATQAGVIVGKHIATGGQFGVGMEGLVERVTNPTPSETKPRDINQIYPLIEGVGLTPELRGAYEALEAICAKTIGCSDDLPDRTNRWGEIVPQTSGTAWNYFSPVRVVSKPAMNIVNKELDKFMTGLPPLSRTMNTTNIKLTGPAYADYKKYYNDPASSPLSKKLFGQDVMGGVKPPKPILEAYAELFESDEYNYMFANDGVTKMAASRGHKMRKIEELDAIYKGYAKSLIFMHYPEYSTINSENERFEENMGYKMSTQRVPTKDQVNAEILRLEKGIKDGLMPNDKIRAIQQAR